MLCKKMVLKHYHLNLPFTKGKMSGVPEKAKVLTYDNDRDKTLTQLDLLYSRRSTYRVT